MRELRLSGRRLEQKTTPARREEGQLRASVSTVMHGGITVSDLDDSLRFYRDALGLVVESAADYPGYMAERLLGLRPEVTRVAFLGPPGGGAQVELVEEGTMLAELSDVYAAPDLLVTHRYACRTCPPGGHLPVCARGLDENKAPGCVSDGCSSRGADL